MRSHSRSEKQRLLGRFFPDRAKGQAQLEHETSQPLPFSYDLAEFSQKK